jgi:hypothetical protein
VEIEAEDYNDTLITMTLSDQVNSANVQVSTKELTSNAIYFEILHMTITSVEPDSGIAGQKIAIHGQYFGTKKGTVYFDEIEANVESWSDTLINTTIPADALPGNLRIQNQYERSNDYYYYVKENPSMADLLHLANYIEVHLRVFGKYESCRDMSSGDLYCDTTEGNYIDLTIESNNGYNQSLEWTGDTFVAEYVQLNDGFGYFEHTSLKITGEISDEGNSVLNIFAKIGHSGGSVHYSYGSGTFINIRSLPLLQNHGLAEGIIYYTSGINVAESLFSFGYSASSGDENGYGSSSRLIEIDLENPDYPPELKVIFKQK